MLQKRSLYGLTYLQKTPKTVVHNTVTGSQNQFTELKTCEAHCYPDGTCVIESDTYIVGPLD